MSFVNVQVTTDPTAILDGGINSINATLEANGLPGWTASDATLAVIILSTVAQMIADGTLVAATALPAIFRAFGTQLLGIPYANGEAATVLSTWTFTSSAPTGGYFIAGGTALVIDGYIFYTQADYTSNTGDTTASIMLVASQAGTAYNNLGGVNSPATPNDQIDFVASVVTVGLTSGGVDQQSDDDYQNSLAAELTLQAPRPLVAADFAGMVLSGIAETATGVVVGRATAIDGYYPDGRALSTGGAGSTGLSCTTTSASPKVVLTAPPGNQVPAVGATVTGTGVPVTTFTANTTSGSTTLSAVSSFATCGVGTVVSGAGIPAGTTITAVNTGASTATMSAAASATATGVTVTPTQTVAASPAPTESTFYLSVNASASGTATLTFSALAGYGPTHLTATCSTTSTSTSVTITTGPYPGAIPDVGARVTGTGIPSGATVAASPAPTASAFTLSSAATVTGSASLTISSWTNVQAANCAFVTDSNGNELSATQMDALATWLAGYRPQNWITNVVGPSYTLVYVSCQIHCLPGYSSSSVAANVQAALLAYINPANWGNASAQTGVNTWLNSTSGFATVRYNKILGIIENVPGVDYVPPGSTGLTIGTSPSPTGTSDITLTGPAPLPQSSTTSIPLPTVV